MSKFVSFGLLSLLVSSGLLLSGCDLDDKSPGSVDTSEYNDLVKKYNKLLRASQKVQVTSEDEIELLNVMDVRIGKYTEFRATLLDSASVSGKDLDSLKKQYETAVNGVYSVEKHLISQIKALRENGKVTYQKGVKTDVEVYDLLVVRGQFLKGIKALLRDAHNEAVVTIVSKNRGIAPVAKPAKKQVELQPEEVEVVERTQGGGVARSSQGRVLLNSRSQVQDQARKLRLNPEAASHAYDLSISSGGIVGLSGSSKELTQTVTDIFSHMKASINANSDDLELVFAIDYSGSMGDDIEAVVKNLTTITDSLQAVQRSGRNVKIGILTFGLEGSEKVNKDLTSNLVDIKRILASLLSNYKKQQHSDDPGEASFAGLNLVDRFSWTSINKKVVLITDEPSKEIAQGRTSFIDRVNAKLKANGIQTTIYTIVVGNSW